MTVKNMIKNWRTTAAGLSMIITALCHLGFGWYHMALDEQATTTTILGVVCGVGLILAGDSKASLTKDDADQAYVPKASCVLYKNQDCALKDSPPPSQNFPLNPNKLHTPSEI